MSIFKFSERSKKVLSTVNSDLQLIFAHAITLSIIDFGIPRTGGKRTAEEQNSLYKDGKSRADGYDKKSYHQTGNAVDVYAYVNGKASYSPDHLAIIATAVLQASSSLGTPIEWGGLWSNNGKITNYIPYGWDAAHFQLIAK